MFLIVSRQYVKHTSMNEGINANHNRTMHHFTHCHCLLPFSFSAPPVRQYPVGIEDCVSHQFLPLAPLLFHCIHNFFTRYFLITRVRCLYRLVLQRRNMHFLYTNICSYNITISNGFK